MSADTRATRRDTAVVDDPPDARDHRYVVPAGTSEPPPAASPDDYRRLVGASWHQRGEECTGFALAAIANYHLRRLSGDPDLPSVSRRMLYESAQIHDDRDFEEGSTLRGALKGWYRTGVARDGLWPYDPDDEHGEQHGALTLARLLDARHRPLAGYRRIEHRDVDTLRAALAAGEPVFAAARTHTGWYRLFMPESGSRIERRQADEPKGGHAFVLAGYDDVGFWLHNSWGSEWGEEGYARLPYRDWVADSIGSWVVDLDPEMIGDVGSPVPALPPTRDEITAYRDLWPHLVVLGDDGALASGGLHEMDEGSVGTLLYLFGERTAHWRRRRLAVVADDGRQPLTETISRCRTLRDRYMADEVYPIFVVWETPWEAGLLDELDRWIERRSDGPAGARLPPSSPDLRAAVRSSVARPMWQQMVRRARLAAADGGTAALANAIEMRTAKERTRGQTFEVHLVSSGVGDLTQCWFASRLMTPAATATVAASATPLVDAWETYDVALDRGLLGRLLLLHGTSDDSRPFGRVDGSLLDLVGEQLAPTPHSGTVPLVGRMPGPPPRSDRVVRRPVRPGGDPDSSVHDEAIATICGHRSPA